MSYQQITISGNIGRDAELKYTPQGVAVADFSVAVSKKTGQGDAQQEKTTWFKCTMWREKAEKLAPYIKKGNKILVTGEIDVRTYVDKNNQTQVSIDVTVRDIDFMSSRGDDNSRGEYSGGGRGGGSVSEEEMYSPAPEPQQQRASGGGKGRGRPAQSDEEIPF